MIAYYDLETDGLLDQMTRIHVMGLAIDDEPVRIYHDDPDLPRDGGLREGVELLATADERWAHNGLGFDEIALAKVFPDWPEIADPAAARDSLIVGALAFPDEHLKHMDLAANERGRRIPKFEIGRHRLKAWGYRLRSAKMEAPESWDALTADMIRYNAQDVSLLRDVVRRIAKTGILERPAAVALEQAFAQTCRLQEERGLLLDVARLQGVVKVMATRRAEIDDQLRARFGEFTDVYFTPKKRLRRERRTPFNPQSRAHIARALRENYGWEPQAWTPTGQPKVDEKVLGALPYPEAQVLTERLMLKQRLGQIAEGKTAWWALVGDDGRVHGRMRHNGAVTGRCTHSRPNLGNVPALQKPWGRELRECWVAPEDHRMVVVDASGIDARVIAHYAAKFDGGEFARIILDGDVHAKNMESLGTSNRTQAKQVFYGILYGAQARKVGQIMGVGPRKGKEYRDRILGGLPGLGRLIRGVTATAESMGQLRGLDGRHLWVRHAHAALNTLAQGGAAVLMKWVIVRYHELLRAEGIPFYQVAFVHDEVVVETPTGYADRVKEVIVGVVREAGEHFNLRVPLDAKGAIGTNWAIKE